MYYWLVADKPNVHGVRLRIFDSVGGSNSAQGSKLYRSRMKGLRGCVGSSQLVDGMSMAITITSPLRSSSDDNPSSHFVFVVSRRSFLYDLAEKSYHRAGHRRLPSRESQVRPADSQWPTAPSARSSIGRASPLTSHAAMHPDAGAPRVHACEVRRHSENTRRVRDRRRRRRRARGSGITPPAGARPRGVVRRRPRGGATAER
jgi:hypothetical protein